MVSSRLLRKPLISLWWLGFRFVEMFIGVSLPIGAKIGGGLRIWHFGGVFVNSGVAIGENCTLRQGVTIGNRKPGGAVPRIGNNVELGAYAQVLGDINVGNDVMIGAMSVVLNDVPSGCVAAGVPARHWPSKTLPAGKHDA